MTVVRCLKTLAGVVIIAALVGAGGCQIRPLYATGSAAAVPQASLPAIDVDPPRGRIEQVYRNALLYALRGGDEGTTAQYKLIYRLTKRRQDIAVERGTGTPNAYQLSGGISFLLKDAVSDESIYGASVTSVVTYTRSSQNYSNTRAERDAEDRLATDLAALTQARLAAYFATN